MKINFSFLLTLHKRSIFVTAQRIILGTLLADSAYNSMMLLHHKFCEFIVWACL
jgi:hypothetical protein